MQGFVAVFVDQCVLALGCSEAVVVHAVVFVGVGVFLSGFGAVVGRVVETVAMPFRAGEFGPFDVVGQQFAGLGIHHIYLGPVASAAGYGVCRFASVLAERKAGHRHGAVIGEGVGVDEHFGSAADAVHAVHDALVAGAVVRREVVAAIVFARWHSLALIAVESI